MGKVTIQIPEEAISYARVLVDELRETGAAVDTANWGQMAKVDENAGARDEWGNLWIVGDQFRDWMLSVQRWAEPAGRSGQKVLIATLEELLSNLKNVA